MGFALCSSALTKNPCSSFSPVLRSRPCSRIHAAAKVNHREIGRRLAERCSFSEEDGTQLTKIVMDLVRESVVAGETVVLYKLGTLSSKVKPETTARNPRTGEPIQVPEKRVPLWKHSKSFKDDVASSPLEIADKEE